MAKKKSKTATQQQRQDPTPIQNTFRGQMDQLQTQLVALSVDKSAGTVGLREQWDVYIGHGDLGDFQRLCADLNIEGDLSSKTKCRKALNKVFVNIPQFLQAQRDGTPVTFFRNVNELTAYTFGVKKKNKRVFPKKNIPRDSPLRQLLRMML